jgi:hypothetical protein
MLGKNKQESGELIILKVKSTDPEKRQIPVHFEITRKVNGAWVKSGEVKDVSGRLSKVEPYVREWEGVESPLVKLYFRDDEADETYLIDCRYNRLSRSLFNSLLGLKTFDNVEISLWDAKGKGPSEGKTFPSVSVRQNGERVEWGFTPEQLPKPEKAKVGKKEITSFDELNDFFVEQLKSLSLRVQSDNSNRPAPAKTVAKTEVEEPEIEGPEDEIPF